MEHRTREAIIEEVRTNTERNQWLRERNRQLMRIIIGHLDDAAEALDNEDKKKSRASCDKAVRARRAHRQNHLEIRRLYNRNAYLKRHYHIRDV